MVKGLGLFKTHFKKYSDRYVLIGGTASSMVMEEAGADFRATKDLDIVLCIEVFDAEFAEVFWDFIHKGRYSNKQVSTGRKLFYRFYSPEEPKYPFMLELFSRVPDSLKIKAEETHLTPIPAGEEVSSLSAILLESAYYDFIQQNKIMVDELPIIGPEILIPLKAKAWIDLTGRKQSGEKIDSGDIKKHRNDILRLFPLLPGTLHIDCPEEIKADIRRFLNALINEEGIHLKNLGIRTLSIEDIISKLETVYGL